MPTKFRALRRFSHRLVRVLDIQLVHEPLKCNGALSCCRGDAKFLSYLAFRFAPLEPFLEHLFAVRNRLRRLEQVNDQHSLQHFVKGITCVFARQ